MSKFSDNTGRATKKYLNQVSTEIEEVDAAKANIAGQVFTGDITVPNLITSGTVDGRDVSADGAILDSLVTVEEV